MSSDISDGSSDIENDAGKANSDGTLVNTSAPRLPRTRRRRIPHGTPTPYHYTEWFYSSGVNKGKKYQESRQEYAGRTDYFHHCDDTIRNPDYDVAKFGEIADDGGPLKSFKIEWYQDKTQNYDFWNSGKYIRRQGTASCKSGSFTHAGINVGISEVPPTEDLSVSDYGPTLWSQMKPAQPALELGVFLGEIRDLPRLLYARLEGLKTIGDFYLAVKFGWEPLLRDILDFLDYAERFQKHVDFIVNNAGKPLRRTAQLSVPPQGGTLLEDTGEYGSMWVSHPVGSLYFGGAPVYSRYKRKLTYSVNTRIWASGMFVFWFNEGHVPTFAELTGKLAGLELTPKLMWELIPWSFLIDYFSNIGDILSNLVVEVADQQVSIYAYAMKETTRMYTWWATDGYVDVSVSRRFHTKVRDAIHPFGLSTGSNLSDAQKAIMAALGASRFPRT